LVPSILALKSHHVLLLHLLLLKTPVRGLFQQISLLNEPCLEILIRINATIRVSSWTRLHIPQDGLLSSCVERYKGFGEDRCNIRDRFFCMLTVCNSLVSPWLKELLLT